jgi:tRNA(fMet)-specific endonuclease VapC
MKIVFDTNAYGLCEIGLDSALEIVERATSLFIPTIVYGELYYGFRQGSRFETNIRKLNDFIADYDVQVIPVDLDVARKFGDLFAFLRKNGMPIPTNDIWIGASCMSIGGTLLTSDRHFSQLPQIQIEFLESI